jgi:N-acetyl-gamma-glutamyl-phosphate reductase
MKFKVAVAGASGYVGGELLRLIAAHPDLELGVVTANSNVGQTVGSLHPNLSSFSDHVFQETTAANIKNHDAVFLALPHAKSAELASQLPDEILVLDCGADYRLENSADWKKFYGTDHAGSWPYGMPELTLAEGGKQRGKLRSVKRVAVPGCNVTAITLALAPGMTAGLLKGQDISAVLSVGTSGAGRSASTELLASEIHGSARAYGVGGVHRHTPEIIQNLAKASGESVTVSFTPVLVPMSRGILAVCTAPLAPGANLDSLRAAYQDAYGDESFIEFLPEGEQPKTSSVLGVNTAHISVSVDESVDRAVIVCAIDNLVKGTAGAAIQSMNLALGLPETTGLSIDGVAP